MKFISGHAHGYKCQAHLAIREILILCQEAKRRHCATEAEE
jgi:hypothetical protein